MTTQHGYLVLADISGYTLYVAGTELEHSHEILSELLGLLVKRFESFLTIHKLEGDAIFAYATEAEVQRGETLLEFLESVYVAFRDKRSSMQRTTTCTCKACRNISTLDLKFIAHHGDFIIQQVADRLELVGSDVNLLHRLAKNHIAEATGWNAYLMFTEQCLTHMNINLENTHAQVESYEHLGVVNTYSLGLHQRYEDIVGTRRIFINEQEADLVLRIDFPTPPHVTWEWLQDPVKRNLWNGHVHWSSGDRPNGRTGSGASNHCAHGGKVSTEVIVDWHPFEYSTTESFEKGKKTFVETLRLEPLPEGGTRLHDVVQIPMPFPRFLRRIFAKHMLLRVLKYDQLLMEAARMAGEQHSSASEGG